MSDTVTDDDFYLMANLRPSETGLPMVVWVSERGNNQHDVRVKVCRVHGDKLQPDNMASVTVRPRPRLVVPETLSADDLAAVERWIMLNRDTIIAYWDGTIDTIELARRLRPLDPPIAP